MERSLEQRIAEAVREEVAIVPYDPGWPRMFASEVQFLQSILPANLVNRYEHFGSTAVPGLAAKPVIDMLIEARDLAEAQERIVPILKAQGYDYFWREDVSPPYPWFIKRDASGKRTHHLHFVDRTSELWERLLFRDYLRNNPEETERYAVLKRQLAAQHPNDRIAYTKGKTDYVVAVTGKARATVEGKQKKGETI